MSDQSTPKTSRRSFLQATSGLAASAALTKLEIPGFHMSNDDTIQVALVGCGGRGSGAAINAMATKAGNCKLVAMADVFKDRQDDSYTNVKKAAEGMPGKFAVTEDKKFLGFDAYKKAMDCLNPGDIVILTTPPAFRWVHFTYALSKKLNIFMEKPVCVDGPSAKRMFALNDMAKAAGTKIGVGLMSRHSVGMQELYKRIRDGEIGDITYMRGYRMHDPAASSQSTFKLKPEGMSHLEFQIRRFHSFIWCSGGCFNDFYIHLIDQMCWMKDAWPVKAYALGGRHYKTAPDGSPFVDQNLDSYAVEYSFADGTRMQFDGRCMNGAQVIYSSNVQGTKGVAIASRAGDCGGPQATYRGFNTTRDREIWRSKDNSNPYQNEWEALVTAIKENKPHNEVDYGVKASLVSSLGRMAAHVGQEVSYDDILNGTFEMGPNVDKLTYQSDAPVMPGPDGMYPQPEPGKKSTEY